MQGRSSDSRIILHLRLPISRDSKQWHLQMSSPITAAGPFLIFTGFSIKPDGTLSVSIKNRALKVNSLFLLSEISHRKIGGLLKN